MALPYLLQQLEAKQALPPPQANGGYLRPYNLSIHHSNMYTPLSCGAVFPGFHACDNQRSNCKSLLLLL